MRTWFIDRIVAMGSGFLYGTRFSGYTRYLADRRRGNGLRCRLEGNARSVGACFGVAASGAVLRLLAQLPPGPGEKLFLFIMSIKKRRQELP